MFSQSTPLGDMHSCMQAVQGTHEAVARDAAAGARPSDILAKWSSQASDRHLRSSRGSQAFEARPCLHGCLRGQLPAFACHPGFVVLRPHRGVNRLPAGCLPCRGIA